MHVTGTHRVAARHSQAPSSQYEAPPDYTQGSSGGGSGPLATTPPQQSAFSRSVAGVPSGGRGGAERVKSQAGGTRLASNDRINIHYNAPLHDPCCSGACCVHYPFCCIFWPLLARIDMSRSYVYVRENSLEANFATKYGCLCCECTHDNVSVVYFDQAPFAPQCCKLMVPGCYPTSQPKVQAQDMGCIVCCIKCSPLCSRSHEVPLLSNNSLHNSLLLQIIVHGSPALEVSNGLVYSLR